MTKNTQQYQFKNIPKSIEIITIQDPEKFRIDLIYNDLIAS